MPLSDYYLAFFYFYEAVQVQTPSKDVTKSIRRLSHFTTPSPLEGPVHREMDLLMPTLGF